jgi:hypothetical protein
LTFVDKLTLDKVHRVCKALHQYADDQRITKNRHPYEKFAQFYLKSLDPKEILKQFKALSLDQQNFIKKIIWEEGGCQKLHKRDWAEVEMQNHFFGQTVCRAVLYVGKLGDKLQSLQGLKESVADPKASSEQVVRALKKLEDVFMFITLDDSELKSIMEAVKYAIWEFNSRIDNGDLDFGFTTIKNKPHDQTVKMAIDSVKERLINSVSEPHSFWEKFTLITNLAFQKEICAFIHFYKTHENSSQILQEFNKLDPLIQRAFRIKIWEMGGRQIIPLGDWAEREMMTNLKGAAIIQTIDIVEKKLPFLGRMSNAIMLSELKLDEFRNLVNDLTIPHKRIIEALDELKKEELLGRLVGTCDLYSHIVYEFYMHCKKINSEPSTIGVFEFRRNEGLQFIKNNPHSSEFREFLKNLQIQHI